MNRAIFPRRFAAALIVLSALLCLGVARPIEARASSIAVDIYGPGQRQLNFAQTAPMPIEPGRPLPGMAHALQERISHNIGYMPFLHQMAEADVLGGLKVTAPTAEGIEFRRFLLSRVDIIMTSAWRESGPETGVAELRVYEALSGQLLLGKAYDDVRPIHVPDVADLFCSELMKVLTGQGEFFLSQLAFTRKEGQAHNVWAARATGRDPRRLTDLPHICTSTAFRPDGKALAFTYIQPDGHRLGIWDESGVRLINLKGSAVIGPSFLPDGRLALTLNITSSPDIYLLDQGFNIVRPLAQSWNIDVSPSFDATGTKMVFTSGRAGNPHIFLLDVPSGQVTRVTFEGKYNTSPSISPDGKLVTFSRMVDGWHRIFVHDLQTGRERQLTFGPPGYDDEAPAFAPDGYYIAFTSDRTREYKLYLTTRHGDGPMYIETGPGEAKSPSWAYKR